jgi:hypothetical protein
MAEFKTGPREINQSLIDKFTNFGESKYLHYYRNNANISEKFRKFNIGI